MSNSLIETTVLDDIMSIENQNIILDFFEQDYVNWHYFDYVSSDVIVPYSETKFPAYTINMTEENEKYNTILQIIKKMQYDICEKLDFKYMQNYRYKLNAYLPISDYTSTELYRNIHVDAPVNHLVIIYYVNDNDAETLLFKNKRGYDSMSNQKTISEISDGNYDNIELINSIPHKKGSVLIFDGSTLHSAKWSNKKNRYNINLNLVINNKSLKNLI